MTDWHAPELVALRARVRTFTGLFATMKQDGNMDGAIAVGWTLCRMSDELIEAQAKLLAKHH